MIIDTNVYKDKFCRTIDERAVLSFCIRNIDFFHDASTKLTSKDFLFNRHELIFIILSTLHLKNVTTFDLPIIVNEATNEGIIDNIGGVDYLKSLNDMAITEVNYPLFLSNVIEASTKYKLFCSTSGHLETITNSIETDMSSNDLIGRIESNILDISTSSKSIKEPRDLSEGLMDWFESQRHKATKITGLSTGYPILDKQIDGFIPGTLMVVAARKKMGKSTLLTQFGIHQAFRLHNPVLYIDTELPFEQWRSRVISNLTGIKERDILHGGYDDNTFRLLEKCAKLIKAGRFFHEYMPGYSIEKVVALYKKYKVKHDIQIGVFDYIKEPDTSSLDKERKEYQILGDVTTRLKDLAGELKIPMLAAVQLNRQGDVADSDRVARYGDIVAEWAERTTTELEGGPKVGNYKLIIRDTRRGGGTPEAGIGYKFAKRILRIIEVPIYDQLVNYDDVYNRGDVESYDELEGTDAFSNNI